MFVIVNMKENNVTVSRVRHLQASAEHWLSIAHFLGGAGLTPPARNSWNILTPARRKMLHGRMCSSFHTMALAVLYMTVCNLVFIECHDSAVRRQHVSITLTPIPSNKHFPRVLIVNTTVYLLLFFEPEVVVVLKSFHHFACQTKTVLIDLLCIYLFNFSANIQGIAR